MSTKTGFVEDSDGYLVDPYEYDEQYSVPCVEGQKHDWTPIVTFEKNYYHYTDHNFECKFCKERVYVSKQHLGPPLPIQGYKIKTPKKVSLPPINLCVPQTVLDELANPDRETWWKETYYKKYFTAEKKGFILTSKSKLASCV